MDDGTSSPIILEKQNNKSHKSPSLLFESRNYMKSFFVKTTNYEVVEACVSAQASKGESLLR